VLENATLGPVPRTLEEAIAMGWERTDMESKFSDDRRVEVGIVRFDEHYDGPSRFVLIPFRAEYTYEPVSFAGVGACQNWPPQVGDKL